MPAPTRNLDARNRQRADRTLLRFSRRRALVGFAVATLLCPASAIAQDAAGRSLLPPDLSFWGMVTNADWIVRAVLAGLAFASVVTWTVGLAKGLELLAAGRRMRSGLQTLQDAGSLDRAVAEGLGQSTCGTMVSTALMELRASEGLGKDGVKERVAWMLERQVARANRSLGRGTGILATIGATAPFVGLFGTVWGIMNAFVGIARSQTTNLAVVAPGIAEALLATAIGLVAAIPAVVIYNMFARATAGQRALLADAVVAVMRLLSRDLDRGMPARLRAAE